MELGTYTPRAVEIVGDRLPAQDAIDRPLVVLVREYRTGIVTRYQPDGGNGVIVDVADVRTNEVWIDVLWMNGSVVDNLESYLTQTVPIKLVWTPSSKGGNPWIKVTPLEGQELALAQQWALTNPTRFDTERADRATEAQKQATATTATPAQPVTLPTLPTATTTTPAPPPTDPTQDPQVLALIAQLQAQKTQQAS